MSVRREEIEHTLNRFAAYGAVLAVIAIPLAWESVRRWVATPALPLWTLFLAIAALIIAFLESRVFSQPDPSATFQIQIDSPKDGDVITGRVQVTGTYNRRPDAERLQLLVCADAKDAFWPQGEIHYDPAKKRWSGTVWLAGQPRERRDVSVVALGRPGQLLFDYYHKRAARPGSTHRCQI